MLYLLVAGQQLCQIECRPNLTDPLSGVRRTSHVVKKIVQQIRDRVVVERFYTFIDHQLHLPVGLTEQPLESN